jgi:hypothetical protein
MNRYPVVLACLLTLGLGAALYGAGSTMLVIEPKDMKDGDKKTVVDDGRTITVERDGDTTHVTIEGAEKTEKLTITRDGNEVRIGRLGNDGNTRSFVIGPDRPKIVIDGIPLGDFGGAPLVRPLRPNKMHTFFVCPKDKTQLRVPQDKDDATYKCPVDGTVMEKKRGRGFTFYYDDEVFENLL